MATQEAYWRTNSFKVKDIEKFKQAITDERIIGEIEIFAGNHKNELILGAYDIIPQAKTIDSDMNGGMEDIEFDFAEFLQKHMDNETQIKIVEISHEKLNSVCAIQILITKKKIVNKFFEVS